MLTNERLKRKISNVEGVCRKLSGPAWVDNKKFNHQLYENNKLSSFVGTLSGLKNGSKSKAK